MGEGQPVPPINHHNQGEGSPMTPRIEKTVFISYRRTNLPWALAIYQELTHNGYDVFFDYLSIPSGDFENIIVENIKARAHFVVILTPSALERCNEPGDWLRREIETAIEEKRNIIPLMLESFDFGNPSTIKALTGKLEKLKKYNGLRLHSEYFFEGMNRFREQFLNVALDAVVHTISDRAKQITEEHQVAASEAKKVKQEVLTAQKWFERGFLKRVAESYDEAIHCYSEAIQLEPDFADAYYNRGLAHYYKGDLDGANADYNEAIRFQPELASAYVMRGFLLHKKDDLNGAINDYNAAIRLDPNDANHYSIRATARQYKGDLDGAIEDYTEAIHLEPEDAMNYNFRASVYEKKGDFDKAIEDYTEAIHLEPEDIYWHLFRASVYEKKGDFDKAIEDYTEVIRLEPNFVEAYYRRGQTRRDKSDLDGALTDFDEAIRLQPDYADAYYYRGKVRSNSGDLDGAIGDYSETIRIKPDYKIASIELEIAVREKNSKSK